MNSGLITGLIAGPNRLSKAVLSRKQSIPNAEITQALANIGIARVSLSQTVARTSTDTPSNTDLETLTVSLLPNSRYRVTYRLTATFASCGIKFGINFPSALYFDGSYTTYDNNNYGIDAIFADFVTTFGTSPFTFFDTGSADSFAGIIATFDIVTGSTSTTFGNFSILVSQAVSNATPLIISKNSNVEVLKF
jgi:hypothetical protein